MAPEPDKQVELCALNANLKFVNRKKLYSVKVCVKSGNTQNVRESVAKNTR